ncbi:MAG: hypothetical protein J7K83_02575 [Candidatus Aenigmarchaeota archaeon]|nr:hypothetical protein [Candidatus Aenigmarchaeota archaeon]
MSVEKALSIPYNIMKKYPKVVLPAVLSWIPSILILMLVSSVVGNFNISSWSEQLEDYLSSSSILKYATYFSSILVLYILIDVFLRTYFQIVVFERKKNISQMIEKAKRYFWRMLWTLILKNVVLLLIVLAGILPILLVAVLPAIALLSIPLMLLAILAAIVIQIMFYPLPAIVVKENKSGIEALKRSIEFSRKNFWSLVLLLIIIWVISSILSFILSPLLSVKTLYITIPIYSIIWLFVEAFFQMLPASFYVSSKRQ